MTDIDKVLQDIGINVPLTTIITETNEAANSTTHVSGSGILLISDSTGVFPTKETAWPNLVAQSLGAKYPNSAVMVRVWDEADQAYGGWDNLNAANDPLHLAMSAPDGQARTRTIDQSFIGAFTDLDLRIDVELPDYTPSGTSSLGGQWGGGSLKGHRLRINTDGTLRYEYTTDGSTTTTITSTVSPPLTDGERYQLRMLHDVDNGSGGNDVSFYYRAAGDDAWTQIGATVTNGGTTNIAQPARAYEIGGVGSQYVTAGKYYGVEIRDGDNGANVLPQPITVFEGAEDLTPLGGTATLYVTIGAQGGAGINPINDANDSFVDATRLPKMVDKWYEPLSVILNTGHNETREFLDLVSDLDGWFTAMKAILPFAGYAIMTQNPRTDVNTERHRKRVGQIAGWAQFNNIDIINTYKSILADARGVAALTEGDGIHPNADGAIALSVPVINWLK